MLDNILLLILLNALYYWVVFSTGTRFLKFIQNNCPLFHIFMIRMKVK